MKTISTIAVAILCVNVFGQFASTPCLSGSLPTSCAANTINLTSSFTNSGVNNPVTDNATGCSSVGSDITAGTIYDYDGWFTTTADASGVVDVYAAIISGDPVIGLYSGPCSAPVLLSCDDDGGSGLDAYINQTGLTPGGTYWVRVWDYNGGTGTYEVTTNGGTPPINDNCSNAAGLTVNGSPISGTNYCATVETSDWNDCESNTENNVWYTFTTTVDGDITVNFSSVDCFGSGLGIDVSVFYGTCASFSSYGCSSVTAGNNGSIAEFTGPAGTYYVMVDGDNSGGATALCDFSVDVDFTGCTADAGTNTSPALITSCAGSNVTTVSATGTVNTYLGSDPCIGWGFWVADDPLGVFGGLSGIGNLPTGNNPAGTNPSGNNGDPNYVGVWTSIDFPLANGENPILPDEANGVTYYIAPITLSNCQTGEIATSCFDIGNVSQLYFNPEISYTTVIDCDNAATPTTQVSILIQGGLPSVDGSSFTLTNNGDGSLSSSTVSDGGTVTVTGIPDGGDLDILITDGSGCTETISISAIDAASYCPFCGVDAGTVTETLTGSGTTSGIHHILCFGDQLDIFHNGDYLLPADLNFCGDPPGPSTFNGATAGTCNPGIVYGIFTGLAAAANPFTDPAFTLYGFVGEDQTFLNDGSLMGSLITTGIANGFTIVNNTIYLYPVTADVTDIDLNGDTQLNWHEDIDGDGCLDSGSPIAITMLNDIIPVVDNNCDGPNIRITGGYPEFFPGNYIITNNGLGTVVGTPVSHGESITILDLNDGDAYNITITDPNGCSVNLVGTYNFTQPSVTISGLATDFCVGDPSDNFSAAFSTSSICSSSTIHLAGSDLDQLNTVTFPGIGSTVTGGTVTVTAFGDLSGSTEFWDVLNETGGTIGTVGNTTGTDCGSVFSGSFTLSTTNLTSWSADNLIEFDLQGSAAVNPFLCGTDYVEITLETCSSSILSLNGTNVTDNGSGSGTFSPVAVGTHDVVAVADVEGCQYTDTVQVTVNEVPLLGSTIDPSICAGSTILLSDYTPGEANGVPGVGTWYTDPSFTTPASSGAIIPTNGQQFYYQYVSTAGACSDDASITVTIITLPTATAANNGPLCVGDQLDLTGGANGMTSYAWTGPNSFSSSSQSPTVSTAVTAAMAGTYTITVDNGTCTNTASTTVVVNTLPAATAANNGPLCVGDQLDLTGGANGMTSYAWTGPNSFSSSSQSPTVSTAVTAAMAGTYTITVDNGTCTNTASTTVVVNTLPTATAANNGPLCVGDQLDLTGGANGMTSYAWTGPNSFSSSSQSPTVSTAATAAMAGTYTITVDNGTCTNTASTTVVVNTLPAATAANNGPLCVGDQLDLTGGANGMTSYAWTGPNSFSSSSQSPTVSTAVTAAMAGTYTITVDNGTCTNTASTTVVVNPLPILSSVSNPEVCGNANSINLGAFTPSVTNGVAGSGQWYTGTNNSGSPVSGSQTGLTDGDQFYYEFTSTAGSCIAGTTISVTVHPAPVLTSVSNPSVCADANTIDLDLLTPSETAGVPGSGQWYAGTNNTAAMVSGVQTVSSGDQFFYEYTSTVGSCTEDITITVTVNPVPSLNSITNPSVCADANSIDLSALTPSETAGVPGSGQWYIGTDNSGTPVSGVQTGLSDGDQFYYEYTATTGACTDGQLLTVTVNPLPVLSSVADPEVCANANTINLTSLTPSETAGVPGSGQWYAGTNNTAPAVSGVQTVSDGDQFYYEYTSTTGSCTADLTIVVTVNPLPTANNQNPVGACEDVQGGGTISGIDLSTFESSINGGAGITYDWYSDAGLLTPISTPTSTTVSNGTIVYAEVSDPTTGCSNVASVTFTVFNIPTANDLSRSVCEDILGSGTTTGVNLTANNNAINSGAVTMTWYTDMGLSSPVLTPSSATVVNGDIFYVEVDNGNCANVAEVTYSVTSTITLNDPTPEVCEDSFGGGTSANYDLTSLNGSVYSGSILTSYTWYESDMMTLVTSPTNVTLSDGDQYYIEVADGNCSNTLMITFNVNGLPTVSSIAALEQCDEGSGQATFNLTSAESSINAAGPNYFWYSDAGLSSAIATPSNYTSSTSTVYIVVEDINGCTNDISVDLTVNPLPVANNASLDACNTGANQATFDLTTLENSITGGSGSTVNWYSDAVLVTTIPTPGSFTSVSTVVYAEVVDGNTCSNNASITLTVNPLPSVVNQSPSGICEDAPGSGIAVIDLTSYENSVNGSGNVSFNWFSDISLTTPVVAPSSTSVSNSDIYYVQLIDNTTSCENVASVTFTIFNAPSSNDLTPSICEDVLGSGQTTNVDLTSNNSNINSAAGLSFNWYTDLALTNPVTAPTSTTVSDGDIYYVEVTNGNCSNIAMITYSVTSTITLNDPAPSVCETSLGSGQYNGYDLNSINNSVYAGSGSTVYNWYESDMITPVVGPGNILINNNDQYYLEVIDGNCSNTILINFTVNPLPTMNPTTGLSACDDGTGNATFDLTSLENGVNATGSSYVWFTDADLTSSITTPSTYTSGSSTVFLEVTDNNGCSNSISADLTVNALPNASTTSITLCDNGSGTANFDLTAVESTVNGGNSNSVDWFSDLGLTFPIATPGNYNSSTSSVYAQVSDASTGCTNTINVDLNVASLPTSPILAGGAIYCSGDALLDLSATDNGGTITWYSDAALTNVIGTGGSISPNNSIGTTTYYATETVGSCVSTSANVTVTINATPNASFSATPLAGMPPLEVNYTDNSSGNGLSYSWTFGDGDSSATANTSHIFTEAGSYTTILTVTDNNGCTDSTSTIIVVEGKPSILIIPNIFSPNGDGVNDIFKITGTNIVSISGTIFNRWGQVIHKFDILESGWDGRTVAGVEASEGTYYYIIDAVGGDGKEYNYQGPFQLIR